MWVRFAFALVVVSGATTIYYFGESLRTHQWWWALYDLSMLVLAAWVLLRRPRARVLTVDLGLQGERRMEIPVGHQVKFFVREEPDPFLTVEWKTRRHVHLRLRDDDERFTADDLDLLNEKRRVPV